MKAIITTKPGPPEVLQLKEVEKPQHSANELLIKIHTSSVTRGDIVLRKLPAIMALPMRLMGMRKKITPGHEFAGEVQATGSNVSKFKVGDKVFGTTTGLSAGANAEYICIPGKWANGVIAKIPPGLTYEEAAVLPVGGMAALYILTKANIQKGQKVLIYGASGSVGTYAVQLASKFYGADVTGVCSTANVDLVKSLGAAVVIDYTKEDVHQNSQIYDVIFDAVGKTKPTDWKGSLKSNGHFLTVKTMTKEVEGNLHILVELAKQGKLIPVIDKRYSLAEVPEAHRYVETGHKKGNVVILVAQG